MSTGVRRRQSLPLPRWLIGDWGRWIRDPLDVLRLTLLAGAIATLAIGPREQSFRMVLTFLLVLVPRALDVPRPFDLAFICGMSFQAWGNVFGLFNGIYGYDKIVHFILPCGTAALLYLLLVRVAVVPDLAAESGVHRRVAMILITLAFGLAVGGIYELYEWFADNHLGAHLYASYGDTIGDLTDDALGSLLAGMLIMIWDRAGWDTRRVPGWGAEPPGEAVSDPIASIGATLSRRLRPERHAASGRWHTPAWVPLLTVLADVLRISFAVGFLYSLSRFHWEQSARFALTFLAALVPRVMRTPRPFDAGFALAMAFQAWGDVSTAFSTVSGYEHAVRLIVSIAAATTVYLVLIRLRAVPDFSRDRGIRTRLAIALTGFSFGFSAGIFYEIYVWVANRLLNAQIHVTYDTLIRRLALDAIGALLGAALLVIWDALGWGSETRRAEPRAHEDPLRPANSVGGVGRTGADAD